MAQPDTIEIKESLTFDEMARSLGYVKAEEAMLTPELTPTAADEFAQLEPMLSPKRAAKALSVSERSVVNMIHSGHIYAVRMGKLWRISRDEVMRIAGTA